MTETWVWDALAWIGLIVTALVLLGTVVLALALSVHLRRKKRVRPGTVLELELEHAPPEIVDADPVRQLLQPKRLSLRDVVDALDRATDDGRIRGLVVKLGAAALPLADAEEIRAAVLRFRAKGKFAIAWAESMGEHSHGNSLYYLATGFDEIHVQPAGQLGLLGLASSQPFLKNALSRAGVAPQLGHREEYKSFKNLFTEEGFTPAHRENVEAILNRYFNQLARGVSEGRRVPLDRARELLDGGPYSAEEAREAGLIDAVSFRDGVHARVRERLGMKEDADRLPLLYLARYFARAGRPHGKGKRKIALIHGAGGVKQGRGGARPRPGSGPVMGSDTVSEAFRAAVRDKSVAAIVFRVNSPGGSVVASETIWREVVRAKEAGKPVVVSMGAVAASGGYFVSMPADRIFAQPGTLTGSIGVVGGKVAIGGLWKKLGVSWDQVTLGRNADFFNANREYTPAQWELLERQLDRIYDDFVSKVAESRGLSREDALRAAKGRVWTGEEALELGLVDALGGLREAIAAACELAKIPSGEKFRVQVFPPRRGMFARRKGRESSDDLHAASRLEWVADDLAGFLDEVLVPLRWTRMLAQFLAADMGGEPRLESDRTRLAGRF